METKPNNQDYQDNQNQPEPQPESKGFFSEHKKALIGGAAGLLAIGAAGAIFATNSGEKKTTDTTPKTEQSSKKTETSSSKNSESNVGNPTSVEEFTSTLQALGYSDFTDTGVLPSDDGSYQAEVFYKENGVLDIQFVSGTGLNFWKVTYSGLDGSNLHIITDHAKTLPPESSLNIK